LAWQVDAIEAQSRAQAQQLQEQWERRFEEALSAVKAEEQAKAYVQEVRVEQLMQRLAAVEQKSAIGGGGGGGNGGGGRGGGTVSEEKIAVLITSVELLRGQISDLETQLSAVSARRNGNGNGGGGGLGEVEARLRSVEREQQQTLLSMEERLVSQTEAVIER
jgi:polyhydroxyalkanoate synthesis regulator phasin